MSVHPSRCVLPLALLASACATHAPPPPPAPPPHVPVPVVTPPPPPPRTTDWRDIPLTPGDWRYGVEAYGSAARFGRADADPDFVIRCDRATRTITLARTAAPAPATMAVTTSAGDRALAVAPAAGPPPTLVATLPGNDGFLDRMAFSRGRFVVAVTGTARLVIPSWPEFARVVEDCRG